MVLLLLASMLWTIVRAYLAGGPDAPTLKILLLGIAVFGGGILFSVRYLISLLKQYARKSDDTQEQQEDGRQ